MRATTHPRDTGLKLARKIGGRKGPSWQTSLVAKVKPSALDHLRESGPDGIQSLVDADLAQRGLYSIRIPDYVYALLNREAAGGSWQAKKALAELKAQPDNVVLLKVPGEAWTRALPLEVKAKKGHVTPEQRRVAEKVGGRITYGLEASLRAIAEFVGEM